MKHNKNTLQRKISTAKSHVVCLLPAIVDICCKKHRLEQQTSSMWNEYGIKAALVTLKKAFLDS